MTDSIAVPRLDPGCVPNPSHWNVTEKLQVGTQGHSFPGKRCLYVTSLSAASTIEKQKVSPLLSMYRASPTSPFIYLSELCNNNNKLGRGRHRGQYWGLKVGLSPEEDGPQCLIVRTRTTYRTALCRRRRGMTSSTRRRLFRNSPDTSLEQARAELLRSARSFCQNSDINPKSCAARQRGYRLRRLRTDESRYAACAGFQIFARAFLEDARRYEAHRSQYDDIETGRPLRDPWLSISQIVHLYGDEEPDLQDAMRDLGK